jgi:hypothetical protein
MSTVGRNDPCPCGSGKKYKKCCLAKEKEVAAKAAAMPAPKSADPAAPPAAETAAKPPRPKKAPPPKPKAPGRARPPEVRRKAI